jgi:hypothetical protein
VAMVAVVGAPIAAVAVDKPATPARTCPDGRPAQPLIGGAAVQLVGGGQRAKDNLNEVEVSRVRNAPPVENLQDQHVFGPIDADVTIIGGLNARDHDRIAFVDGAVSAPGRSALYLCGTTISDSNTNEMLRPSAVPIDVFAGFPIDAV